MSNDDLRIDILKKPMISGTMDVRFPAKVEAESFLTVTRANGVYTFAVDYTKLEAAGIVDASAAKLAFLDQSTGTYKTISISDIASSTLPEDLQAIAALTGEGILERTGDDTWTLRTSPNGELVGTDDLATVATTGDYGDLSSKPTLGTAAFAATTDFATAAQGAKADSAVQSIVAGSNITIDDTDPKNPIVSSTGGGGGAAADRFETRADAIAAIVPTSLPSISIVRYATDYPECPTTYIQGSGPAEFEDAGGTTWSIDVSGGNANVLSFGAPIDPGDDSTDATAAFVAANAAAKNLIVPGSLFVISQWVPLEGSTIIFQDTKIKQKPNFHSQHDETGSGPTTGNYDVSVIWIQTPNVRLRGKLTVEGNIADDTGEWNHAVQVGHLFGGQDIDISGVEVCPVHGVNIRGDVLYVSGTADSRILNCRFGFITGDNILRSAISLIGGRDLHFDGAECFKYSYRTMDIEPNAGSQKIENIYIERITGGSFQLAVGTGATGIGAVHVEYLTLDASRQVETVPPYLLPDGVTHYFAKDIGLNGADFESLNIGRYSCNGMLWSAVNVESTVLKGRVRIREYKGSNPATGNPTRGEFYITGLSEFIVDNLGSVTLPVNANSTLINADTTTRVSLSHGTVLNGRIINQGAQRCEFHDLFIAPGTTSTGALFNSLIAALWDRVQTSGGAGFSSSCDRGVVQGCTISNATISSNSHDEHAIISSRLNGVYYSLSNGEKHYANAISWGYPGSGGAFIWVDTSGKLRVKLNAAPTSDTDGTVVGTQT